MARQGTTKGWRWGPFVFRLPFLHSKLVWPEFLQGLLVSTATGLALVPILMGYFGLEFEQAVACVLLHSILLVAALYVFGEPYAPGWTTPALPLVVAYVAAGWPDPASRFQAMTALTLMYTALVCVLGVSGLGEAVMRRLPVALKAGILLGAALSAFLQVFRDEGGRFLAAQPVTTVLACLVSLVCVFSVPFHRWARRWRPVALMATLGLLPGFLVAAVVGPLVGEVEYDVQWGWLLPPVAETIAKMSPFSIGWPSLQMYLAGIPLVLVTYILQFGDWVTGNEVLREAAPARPDDPVDINESRSHLALAIRNFASALACPFLSIQGTLWTGVQVVVANRWKEGPRAMPDLHSGLMSYYLMGLPVIFFLLPLLTALKPLLGVAMSLTLVTSGFACAYIGMAIPKDAANRGAALLTGIAIALFDPWIGLAVGVGGWLLLVGHLPVATPAPSPSEES